MEPEIVPGNTGDFEVIADGELLFSKQTLGRFPNPGEVADLMKKKRR